MRNYILELKQRGYSTYKLKKETGLSAKDLTSLAKQKTFLKSGTRKYENVRNANRRLGYREAKKSGFLPKEASRLRRIIFTEKEKIGSMVHKLSRYRGYTTFRKQLRILGEFRNYKTKEVRFQWGGSSNRTDKTFSYNDMLQEAVRACQKELGSSNWELQRIVEKIIVKFEYRK